MHFTGTIWRPPYEAGSALLQVTAGCTWDRCKFCSLYEYRFKRSPVEEVEQDLQELAIYDPNATRVFLTGANPFALSFDKLEHLAQRIHRYLPRVTSIGCFARVTDIAGKTDEQLAALHALGYDRILFGTETGDNETLKFMNKGYAAQDIVAQLSRMDKAEVIYHISYLNGLAGAGNSKRNALASAQIYNQIHPEAINLVALTVFPQSELFEELQAGNYQETGELERLEEERLFLEHLQIPTAIFANTVSNTAPLVGMLPQDREKMLAYLQEAIHREGETELRQYRTGIRHL